MWVHGWDIHVASASKCENHKKAVLAKSCNTNQHDDNHYPSLTNDHPHTCFEKIIMTARDLTTSTFPTGPLCLGFPWQSKTVCQTWNLSKKKLEEVQAIYNRQYDVLSYAKLPDSHNSTTPPHLQQPSHFAVVHISWPCYLTAPACTLGLEGVQDLRAEAACVGILEFPTMIGPKNENKCVIYIYICTYTVFIRYTLVYIHRKASSNIQIHTPKSLSEILLRTWHWWPLQPKWLVIANHPLRPGRKNCEDLKFQPPSDRVFYGAWKVSSSWPNVTS